MPTLSNLLSTGKTLLSANQGQKPSAPLRRGSDGLPINNTFELGTYEDYVVDLDPNRASDVTQYNSSRS